jgi:hypothetical protein
MGSGASTLERKRSFPRIGIPKLSFAISMSKGRQ